jgi:hypothetical protein
VSLSRLADQPSPRFSDGRFDVRGWDVVTLVDREKVGEVHDLLLDEAGEPRYLDVDLGFFRRHVLVPIGQARADRARRIVWVPGFTREQFAEIPPYDHDLTRVDRAYEDGLVAAYVSAYAGERYHPRPPHAGAVYGPSELETRVRTGTRPRIAPLGRLRDIRIAPGDPDLRGWTLTTADGAPVGHVEELLVDTRAMKVRYLVCALDEGAGDGAVENPTRVLLPIGYARLHEEAREVRVDAITADELRRLPSTSGRELRAQLDDETRHDGGIDAFYLDPRFDPRTFYGQARA